MTTPGLHIERMETHARVAGGGADAAQVRGLLERAVSAHLPPALDRRLDRLFAEQGWSREAELIVRRVAPRLRVRGGALDGATLAEGLAEALVRQLTAPATGASAEHVDENWACFPDRIAAETRYLIERSRRGAGARPAWWWEPLFTRGAPPGAAEILLGWVESAPERAAHAIRELVRQEPALLGRALSNERAVALASRLLALRAERTVGLRRRETAPRSEPGPAEPYLDSLFRDPVLLGACARGDASLGERALLAVTAACVAQPAAATPQLSDLLAALGSLDPGGWRQADTLHPEREPATGEPEPGASASAPPTPREEPRAERRAPCVVEAPWSEPAPAHEVCCAGLLFLLRPLIEHGVLEEHAGAGLGRRLQGFAVRVIERVLPREEEVERPGILLREEPILRVFRGSREPLDETRLALRLSRREAADVERWIERVASLVPDATAPAPDGLPERYRALLGEDASSPLQHAVIRSARIAVGPFRADLHLPLASSDAALRRFGWDVDPGWLPPLGRIVCFHFEDTDP